MSQASNKPFDRDRQAAVDSARQEWMNCLIDLSRHNKLLYEDKKLSKLDFSRADYRLLTALLAGRSVAVVDLFPYLQEEFLANQVYKIHKHALANAEKKNLKTLFLAIGLASWSSHDGGSCPQAPVLLVPMELDIQGVAKLRRNGKAQINPVLLHCLRVQHGCAIAPQDLLRGVESVAKDQSSNADSISIRLDTRLEQAAAKVPGFKVKTRAVLSNFSFRKMAMVQDLSDSLDQMVAHEVIAAMTGDVEARQNAQGFHREVDARELDRISPGQEFLVFDADSSQQLVIQAVLAGRNGVIQGPPGTGKSQTIANLIVSLASSGQRVLFVAEKKVALEVVKRKLEQKNLGHLMLDIHSKSISSRAVMQQFKESFEKLQTVTSIDSTNIHFQLQERRIKLNQHVEKLHEKHLPSNLSVDEIQGELLKFSACEQISTRFQTVDQITSENANAIEKLLTEISSNTLVNLFLDTHSSPWNDIKLSCMRSDISQVFTQVRRVVNLFKLLKTSLHCLVGITQFALPTTLEEIPEWVFLLEEVNHTLSIYSADIFCQNLEEKINALCPARPDNTLVEKLSLKSNFIFEKFFPRLNPNEDFNRTVLEIRALRVEGVAPQKIFIELKRIDWQLKLWRSLSTTFPCDTSKELSILKSLFEEMQAALSTVEPHLKLYSQRYWQGQRLSQVSLDQLSNLFDSLERDQETPKGIIRLWEIEQEIERCGAKSILVEFKQSESNPYLWVRQFRYAWLASQLEQALLQDPTLATFKRESHEKSVAEFRQLDQEHLRTTADRVRDAHAERVDEIMRAYPTQDSLVQEQVKKGKNYLPLRQLFAEAPNVLTALRPCWMVSPLSVSQLLDAQHCHFDVVIFDEASQVLPEDAIPAILRARRVVVAGDRYQLPPTKFFVTADDENEESLASSSESLLDLMSTFLEPWLLSWHYRSHDESLIAFSNRHIYGDRLITFPSPTGQVSVSHVLVSSPLEQNGQENSSDLEVKRVVELVIEHVVKRPNQTLGVITMGSRHAKAIEALLEDTLKDRSELNPFFDKERCECFFVKSIEKVQGDERDAIILSVGYKKNSLGNLPHRFGPLLQKGGERRLNVAITRARQHMTLVSSFDHQDVDLTRSKARGVELLRSYIQYSSNQGKFLEDDRSYKELLSSLELDIFNALETRGILLLPQWGSSQYPISMVARHPDRPERFVLAIESDGPNYYSAKTVRDRDRLRPQQLEKLGWHIHRIWSIDWFRHRDVEIERAVVAYRRAVEYAD